MAVYHQPVMLKEVMEFLQPKPGQHFLDCTVGGGGHAREILRLTSPDGKVLGIDWDEEALALAKEELKEFGERAILFRENFVNLAQTLVEKKIVEVDGALFDLGVSFLQLSRPERGFSFREEGPLDMRMDQRRELSAGEVVNRYSARELEELIRKYGGERWAKRIAQSIIEKRKRKEITTTVELAKAVVSAIPPAFRPRDIHPATRTFQAIRIVVNDELENLEKGLKAAVRAIRKGGRLVVLSFHSLEDGIVKRELNTLEKGCICPPRQPFCTCGRTQEIKVLTRHPLVPKEEEVKKNPHSRSAKFRAAEKVG